MSLLDLLFGQPNIENLKAKKDISGLLKALEYPKEVVIRQKAAEVLGELGNTEAIPSLVDALEDAEVEVRCAVCKALGQLKNEQAIKPLVTALKDKKAVVRQAVSNALGQIGSAQAVKSLITALNDKDANVREEAARALGQIGDARAIKPLITALTEHNGLEQAVAFALKKLGKPAISPLIALLKHNDQAIRNKASLTLEKLGKSATSSLVPVLISENDDARHCAADLLEKFGWQPTKDEFGAAYWIIKQQWDKCVGIGAPAVEPLTVLLGDKDWVVRWAVTKALGQIGDPRSLQPLMFAMGDADANVRHAAAEALGQIGDPSAVDPLVVILKDADAQVRNAIVLALVKIGQPSVKPLVAMLKDQAIRKIATETLDRLGWKPEKNEFGAIYWIVKQQYNRCVPIGAAAVPPLVEVLRNSNEATRQAVAEVLKQIGPASITPLTAFLDGNDGNLRQIAASVLHKLGWQPHQEGEASVTYWVARRDWNKCIQLGTLAVAPLISILGDADMTIRQGATEALGEIGDTRAIEPLVALLIDPQRSVRFSAAQSLSMLGWQPVSTELQAAHLVGREDWDKCVELGEESVEALEVALRDWDNWEVGLAAAKTLGKIGGAPVVEALIRAFKDTRGGLEMRKVVAEILGEIGDIRTVRALIDVINNPNDVVDVHRIATKTLEQLDHPQAQNWFSIRKHITRLEDKEWSVRKGAAEALAILYQHGSIDEQSRKLILSKQGIMAERHHDETVLSCNWTHHHDNGIGIML